MAPRLTTVRTGRIQHTSRPRAQRIRSHRLNLDKIKEDALTELFASNNFSIVDEASKVALPESDDEMEDIAMNVALPTSDDDEDGDLVDELEDLFVGDEKSKPKDYEDTAEFAMETIWSEDLDEEDIDDEDDDEQSVSEDENQDDDGINGVEDDA